MSVIRLTNQDRARRNLWLAVVPVLCLLSGLSWPAILPAQTPLREQTSLKFIPDDAAFYGSTLRLKRQFDSFVASKAFARLRELSFVKSAVEEIKKEWAADSQPAEAKVPAGKTKRAATGDEKSEDDEDDDDDSDTAMTENGRAETIRNLKAFWSDPANQQLVGVGLDALSNEIFIYGDNSIIGFLKELENLNVDLSGLGGGGIVGQADLTPDNAVIKALLDSLDKLPVPAFVFGFKLSDQAVAKAQLARLEKALREGLQEYPDIAKGFRREKIGPGEFLTLKLDGSKIPWDELIDEAIATRKRAEDAKESDDDDDDDDPQDDASEKKSEEQARALIKALAAKLDSRTLTLSLGLYESYLVFSFGETNAHLAKFSGKGKRLIDRPEFAPLLKFADKPLTGIDYVSQEVSRVIQRSSDSVDKLTALLEKWGTTLGLDEDAQEKLVKDVNGLAKEGAALIPNPGAVVEWQYLTPRGYEGYSYNFGGGDKALDGSKKLTILEHVGGNPLVVVAARHKGRIEGYQFLAKCLAAVSPHLDVVLTTHLPGQYSEQYSQIKEEFAPLLEKFHTITGKQFLPALAEGQSAFVIDGKPVLVPLSPALLPGARPLPFPAPALVYGVKDAALLKQACGAYFVLLQDMVNALSRLNPEQIPAITLPPPAERDAPGGKLYVYAIPGAEEGENEIAPTGAVGANVAVLSLVPDQAKRYLTKTKFLPAGVLARIDKPATRVWYVNVAGIIDMIQPWVDYGLEMALAFGQPTDTGEAGQTLKTIFEVLKCWRGSAGIQFFDGSTLVEFSESVFEDLK